MRKRTASEHRRPRLPSTLHSARHACPLPHDVAGTETILQTTLHRLTCGTVDCREPSAGRTVESSDFATPGSLSRKSSTWSFAADWVRSLGQAALPFAVLALIVALGLLPGLTPALAQDAAAPAPAAPAHDNIFVHIIKSVGLVFGPLLLPHLHLADRPGRAAVARPADDGGHPAGLRRRVHRHREQAEVQGSVRHGPERPVVPRPGADRRHEPAPVRPRRRPRSGHEHAGEHQVATRSRRTTTRP